VSPLRQKLMRSGYLAVLATSMAGWIWVLFESLVWVLGT